MDKSELSYLYPCKEFIILIENENESLHPPNVLFTNERKLNLFTYFLPNYSPLFYNFNVVF